MTYSREAPNEIDATNAESAEEFIIWWDFNVEAVSVWWLPKRRTAALFKLVPVQWVCKRHKT